jgi:hypothetical protein
MKKSTKNNKIRRAAALYERFTGASVDAGKRVAFPGNPQVALAIGKVLGIMYETTRDGRREKYLHEFNAVSRPLFAVSYDGKQLYMIGGSYNFTERGIVDKRPRKRR